MGGTSEASWKDGMIVTEETIVALFFGDRAVARDALVAQMESSSAEGS